ncbi:MAG: flavodoxin family protein [Candidatus Hermodarchaeota archaeon]|nr:flavodoxin family protein [Candidatus Hermodarchaeota archaeon]
MTKIFAINGSPRMEKGNTNKILTPFLEGLKNAGASVDLVYARRLKINPCIGDFQCWFEKIGDCIHKDDMQSLYTKMREADIIVLATPVYIPLPGEMQNFINRLCPIVEPILEFREGRTRARLPKTAKISKFVLVSSSGWWEIDNFNTVIRIVEEIALNTSTEFAGALLRPHAGQLGKFPEKAEEIFAAARAAGIELISNGIMSEKTLKIISQPLIKEEELRNAQTQAHLNAKEK